MSTEVSASASTDAPQRRRYRYRYRIAPKADRSTMVWLAVLAAAVTLLPIVMFIVLFVV